MRRLVLVAALLAAGCATSTTDRLHLPPLRTVPHVDLKRYLGTWYEIASFPQPFQRGCTATTATYALRDDGDIDVVNRCRKGSPDGPEKVARGRARVVDRATNARLEVSFFRPFWGDYWIVELGEDYSYAVVGHPSRDYLWILARSPAITPELYASILGQVAAQGYDTARLARTVQPAEPDATTRRILAPARADWPSYGRDYGQQRFSPLAQIDRSSVARLAPRWTFETGVEAAFQATPIVVDGVMYVSLPYDHVVALDARDGRLRWRYEHRLRPDRKMCCGPANRGVAVGYGKVFIGTVDARLVALDAATGAVAWDVDVGGGEAGQSEVTASLDRADPFRNAHVAGSTGVGINMAPIVYAGKVIVGITGVGYGLHLDAPRAGAPVGAVIGVEGRYGRPGFLAAYDVESGKRVWRFDTVPASGWEGRFTPTTPDGVPLHRDVAKERAAAASRADAWRYGGGSAWTSPTIDVARGLLFFGTGNPSPQLEDASRPGDNLYTVSLVALDAATGKLRWHYQQVPHDLWGYDVASPPVLFDLVREGKKVPAVAQAGKVGWLYVHDRTTGELLVRSEALVPQRNLFAPPTAEGTEICPAAFGGVNWSPAAIDPENAWAFVAGIHWPMRYTLHEAPAEGGRPALRYTSMEPVAKERWGLLSSVDLATGKLRWQHRTPEPLIGGVLATAGGLVFFGEGDGHLDAVDAATGAVLWRHACPSGANAPPITYEVEGVQYVAVAAGGNPMFGFKAGQTVMAFALGAEGSAPPAGAAPAPGGSGR